MKVITNPLGNDDGCEVPVMDIVGDSEAAVNNRIKLLVHDTYTACKRENLESAHEPQTLVVELFRKSTKKQFTRRVAIIAFIPDLSGVRDAQIELQSHGQKFATAIPLGRIIDVK